MNFNCYDIADINPPYSLSQPHALPLRAVYHLHSIDDSLPAYPSIADRYAPGQG